MVEKIDKPLRKIDKANETLVALMTCSTKTAAAEKLGISRETLYNRIEEYGLQNYLDKIQEDAVETLKKGTIKAAENFVKKIGHVDAEISMKASGEVLDRAGITKKTDGGNTNIQINVTPILGDKKAE